MEIVAADFSLNGFPSCHASKN